MLRLIFIACLMLSGCNNDRATKEIEKILVSGQSNAARCNWSYLEEKLNVSITNISKGGTDIDGLIDSYYDEPLTEKIDIMILVHGERDSLKRHSGYDYVNSLAEYQSITGVEKIYISSVGYHENSIYDDGFDEIRSAVEEESKYRDDWIIAYKLAKSFRDRGMMKDHIHFSESGCIEMMDSVEKVIHYY